MRLDTMTSTIIVVVVLFHLNFLFSINAQSISMCDTSDENNSLGVLCGDDEQSLKEIFDAEDEDLIPDFDLNQIETEHDANQILRRFRRGRFSSSGSRSSSSGSRFSSSFGSRSSSSSGSSGSRFFGGSRSSSSSSSSGGSSRIFSRSSGSSSSGSGSRIFSRSGSSSSSSSSGSSGGLFSRGSSSSSGSSGGLFSRGASSGGSNHRLREAIRSAIRKPTSSGSGTGTGGLSGTGASKPSITDKIRKITHGGGSSGTGGLSGAGGSKPGLSDKIRKITHGGGGSGSGFGGAGSSGFGGSGGSGGNAWVRAGKKFLPVAVRFGKRYYQRRKYNKAIYAGAGAGAGYYAGSRMNQHHGNYYPNNQYDQYSQYDNYGYPPVIDNPPEEVDGQKPTVFYCIQEDLNTTLVNKTLDKEGFGVCNISGDLVKCPIEIECKTSESDNCCEDDQGTPYCCGGAIPDEYSSQYGGYADDYDAGSDTLHIFTAIWIMMSTICFIIWQRRE